MQNLHSDLNDAEIIQAIKESIHYCMDETGWANLSELGGQLRARGVRYEKLKHFLSQYEYLVEIFVDHSTMPPVSYARLIQQDLPPDYGY